MTDKFVVIKGEKFSVENGILELRKLQIIDITEIEDWSTSRTSKN